MEWAPQSLTLNVTKYEVIRCTHVEVISIFVDGMFWSPCFIHVYALYWLI